MDAQILEWKAMWQEQKSDTMESSELIKQLNKIETTAKIRRITLFMLAAALIITSSIRLSELLSNTYFLVSYVMILGAISIKLVPLYKTKFETVSNLPDLNNHDFIKKLVQKANYNIKHLLSWLSLAIVALNIALLGLYEKGIIFNYEMNDENRIYFHLATIALFVIGYFHNKRNLDKTKGKILNLVNDLEDDSFQEKS